MIVFWLVGVGFFGLYYILYFIDAFHRYSGTCLHGDTLAIRSRFIFEVYLLHRIGVLSQN